MFDLPVKSWLAQVERRARRGLVVAVCLTAIPLAALADTSPTSQSSTSPAPVSHWAEQVLLGSSTAELTGPWKFHKGDNMDWARPEFNDLGWSAMDLTPPQGSYDPFLGTGGFVPGWTALGDPGYSGYAWYRLKTNVQYDSGPGAKGALKLKLPNRRG